MGTDGGITEPATAEEGALIGLSGRWRRVIVLPLEDMLMPMSGQFLSFYVSPISPSFHHYSFSLKVTAKLYNQLYTKVKGGANVKDFLVHGHAQYILN